MTGKSSTHAGCADENPPPYHGSGPQAIGDNVSKLKEPESESPPPRAPPNIPRCNLLNISRPKEGIKGEYVVDPSVTVPDTLLAPLPEELQLDGTRPNLRLASNQSVEADVWVLGAPSGDSVRLIFISRDAAVKVRIHDTGTTRCLIEARSGRNVTLTLPRDFVGVVTTTTSCGPAAMSAKFATLSEVEGEGKYFKGDLARLGANDWPGSSVEIVAPVGKISVMLAGDTVADECVVS